MRQDNNSLAHTTWNCKYHNEVYAICWGNYWTAVCT